MLDPSTSTFRNAALTSGLLTHEQIGDAIHALVVADDNASSTTIEVSDDQLADYLIHVGRLNFWQAEQLKRGRTRFTLGPYRVLDSIGQGGMGQVFKAEHSMMGRVVAVKVLPKEKTTPESIANFSHEIRAQARLDHPNLVRAYDAGHDGNVYYLITEFVPGADLRKLVRSQSRLGQREASTIIAQVAHGLQHAHEMGLIHRDTKPGNVLVTPEGLAKLSDLGLAGFLIGEWEQVDPREGKIVGTVDYLSPEQILSPRDVTPRCDIYSLGCTLYYAVTGKVPFPGGSRRHKCHRHCNEAPLNPRRFNPDLSVDFLNVLADMMEKDPLKRIATAAEVAQRLAPWTDEAAFSSSPPDDSRWTQTAQGSLSADTSADVSDLLEGSSITSLSSAQSTESIESASQDTQVPPSQVPPPHVSPLPLTASWQQPFVLKMLVATAVISSMLTLLISRFL